MHCNDYFLVYMLYTRNVHSGSNFCQIFIDLYILTCIKTMHIYYLNTIKKEQII